MRSADDQSRENNTTKLREKRGVFIIAHFSDGSVVQDLTLITEKLSGIQIMNWRVEKINTMYVFKKVLDNRSWIKG
jgi:hypothetical protein